MLDIVFCSKEVENLSHCIDFQNLVMIRTRLAGQTGLTVGVCSPESVAKVGCPLKRGSMLALGFL